MRCEILKNYEAEVQRYCVDNLLSYSKLINSSLSWNKRGLVAQYNDRDPKKEALGLMDNTPMPVLLEIYLENGRLRFVQTDITHKYLGVDRKTETPAVAKKPATSPWRARPHGICTGARVCASPKPMMISAI